MPQCCAVPFCSKKKGGHRFPRDKTVSKQWLAAIRRDNYTPSKHSRVCKKHFIPDDYVLPKEPSTENPTPKLRPKAVPSRFSWTHESEERKEIKRKRAERALQCQQKRETAKICSMKKNQCEELFVFEETCEELDIEISHKDVIFQCTLYKCEGSSSNISNISKHENYRKSTLNMFRIENLKEKPDIVQFYTGFDNYSHLMFVFHLFGDEVNHLKYYPSLQLARGKHALTPCDQFYLTLIKLRRNMCNKELSFHFEISTSSASKYFITWINYLYCKFKDLNVWVPKEIIDENVMCPKKTNTSTVIIDCTEIKIEKPQHPVSQQATYSNYKSANTLKVLVGISSSGYVTFVSDAYGGSIRELFEKCGIMNLLQKGDIILGDRGFNIQDLVTHMDVTVNMPHFLKKGSNQFEAQHLRESKKISSFKILSNKLSSNLVSLRGRMYLCVSCS